MPVKLHVMKNRMAITTVEIITPPKAYIVMDPSCLLMFFHLTCKDPAKSKKPSIILSINLLISVCSMIFLISEY
jgi:hypothetical protein